MDKRTTLYECHVASGGKMVSFGGFEMPVQYGEGVIKEHMAVRTAAGMFDVSHMGEFILKGTDVLENLNRIMTNDFTNMKEGRVRYTVMCNDDGGCVDDLVVYKMGEEEYMLVVNASNTDKDARWIEDHIEGDALFENISDKVGQIALQGPASQEIIAKLADVAALPDKYYTFTKDVDVAGVKCIVSRTGYTGEFGYEIYMDASEVEAVWKAISAAGEEFGLELCGLGSRDTLRLEAGMPLYGHEMNDSIDPVETGLGFAVKTDKDFIGRDAILAKGEPSRTRVGLKVTGRGIVRDGSDVFLGDEKLGVTTSGTYCPYLGFGVAMALIDSGRTELGAELSCEVRGRNIDVEIVELPFYRREKR